MMAKEYSSADLVKWNQWLKQTLDNRINELGGEEDDPNSWEPLDFTTGLDDNFSAVDPFAAVQPNSAGLPAQPVVPQTPVTPPPAVEEAPFTNTDNFFSDEKPTRSLADIQREQWEKESATIDDLTATPVEVNNLPTLDLGEEEDNSSWMDNLASLDEIQESGVVTSVLDAEEATDSDLSLLSETSEDTETEEKVDDGIEDLDEFDLDALTTDPEEIAPASLETAEAAELTDFDAQTFDDEEEEQTENEAATNFEEPLAANDDTSTESISDDDMAGLFDQTEEVAPAGESEELEDLFNTVTDEPTTPATNNFGEEVILPTVDTVQSEEESEEIVLSEETEIDDAELFGQATADSGDSLDAEIPVLTEFGEEDSDKIEKNIDTELSTEIEVEDIEDISLENDLADEQSEVIDEVVVVESEENSEFLDETAQEISANKVTQAIGFEEDDFLLDDIPTNLNTTQEEGAEDFSVATTTNKKVDSKSGTTKASPTMPSLFDLDDLDLS